MAEKTLDSNQQFRPAQSNSNSDPLSLARPGPTSSENAMEPANDGKPAKNQAENPNLLG
jgi:hypothetical protein